MLNGVFTLEGILSWIGFGLIAGLIAKILLPGPENMGWIRTIVIGVAGSFVGVFVGSFFGLGSPASFTWQGIGTAVAGAFLLLLINRIVTRS